MALLTTYGDANRVVSQGLLTVFGRETVSIAYGTEQKTHIVDKNGTPVTEIVTEEKTIDVYLYTRTRTKTYRYVGMSESVAQTCAAALVAYYNRTAMEQTVNVEWTAVGTKLKDDAVPEYDTNGIPHYKPSDYEDEMGWAPVINEVPVSILAASVNQTHSSGHMWQVDVQVNESVSMYSAEIVSDPNELFNAKYPAWGYEE